jgi:uncharacterized protein YhbP (UPF0306 family)
MSELSQTDVASIINDYLQNVLHLSLATSVNDKPWVCEVHFVYDGDMNLYFRSLPTRRHSEEIAQNPNVAGNIVVQHERGEAPRGVYFEGTAELLKGVDENHIAYTEYCRRLGTGPAILEDASNPDGHQFYKITVRDWYLFDARESKPSKKYRLVRGAE